MIYSYITKIKSCYLYQKNTSSTYHNILFIMVCVVVTYQGVIFLGLGMDDYRAIYNYKMNSFLHLAQNANFNRFPFFSLFALPILLYLPNWMSHLIVIIFHTSSSILIGTLARYFKFNNAVSYLASLLFLIWPSHNEVLFWISASNLAFGLCIFLVGTLMLIRGNRILSFIIIFFSLTFSEGMVLPALFFLLILLHYQRHKLSFIFSFIGSLICAYGLFELLRKLLTKEGTFTEYTAGFDKLLINISDLVALSSGLVAGRDNTWMWERVIGVADITILLPPTFMILAAVCGLLLLLFTGIILNKEAHTRLNMPIPHIVLCMLGYASCFPVYIVVTGNVMQNRFTYLATIYLALASAIVLEWLISHSGAVLRYVGLACAILLISVSIFRMWSTVWENWYPAGLVAKNIITDVQQTHKETDVDRIWLVNDPQLVGTGYALYVYVYDAVGKLYIGPQFGLVSAQDYIPTLLDSPKAVGTRFSDQPCVFLGWQDRHRIVVKQILDSYHNYVLNCDTQTIEAASSLKSDRPYLVVNSQTNMSHDNLQKFPLH